MANSHTLISYTKVIGGIKSGFKDVNVGGPLVQLPHQMSVQVAASGVLLIPGDFPTLRKNMQPCSKVPDPRS